jgi:rhamnosyltransferase
MRSKDAAWVISQSLAALFAQDFTDFELLVVDSGSTDGTVEIIREYPGRLIEISARDYYPGAVLNGAVEQTHGELIVYQNSDAVPLSPRMLGRLVGAFAEPAVQAAFARQVPRPEAESWVRRDYAASFPAQGDPPPWLPYSLPLAAMRRSAWRQHPFQTQTWGSEDVEWGYWARAHGRAIRYVPEAVVMHSHNYTLRQLYGRRYIEGEADAFIHRRPLPFITTLAQTMRSFAGDVPWLWRDRSWAGLLLAPARRAVFHWAFRQGHRWGTKRLLRGDADASHGQQIVLDRYRP